MDKKITLLEALTGFHFQFTHLDGKKITVATAPGEIISHHEIKSVRGKGMPFFKDAFSYGNLYIKFNVEFPKKGSVKPDQIDALRKILPGPKQEPLDK